MDLRSTLVVWKLDKVPLWNELLEALTKGFKIINHYVKTCWSRIIKYLVSIKLR